LYLPKLNLKTTIIASSLLAVLLNIFQFASSVMQRKDAFAPAWAYTADATPDPSPAILLTPAQVAPTAPAPSASAVSPTAQASAQPPADPTPGVAATLSAHGLKPEYAGLYLWVQAKTGTPWQILAAVHRVETGQSGSTTRTSYAGATGPMQFMPATFSHYAQDGNGDGTKDIHNLEDSMLTAGHYLAAGGAAQGHYSQALYTYNHSWSYVSKVTGIANSLGL
jgi:membrane-bound lytic murein transglycosylase B